MRTARAGPSEAARASEQVAGSCRDVVLGELTAGRRRAQDCDRERRRAGRAAVRAAMSFGYVISREVDLHAVRMVVGKAVLCRRWPLRAPEGSVLRSTDIDTAGCRTRRVKTGIAVTVLSADGARQEGVMMLRPDADGRVALSYGALDLELRAQDLGALHDYVRVEVGVDGWAGTLDLQRLQEFRAGWHLRWVRGGRGAPLLFATRHPEHRAAAVARELAEQRESLAARALLDEVLAGKVSPAVFVVRYPDSPLRASAEAMMAQPGSEAPAPTED